MFIFILKIGKLQKFNLLVTYLVARSGHLKQVWQLSEKQVFVLPLRAGSLGFETLYSLKKQG